MAVPLNDEHSHLGPSGWDGFVRCPGKPNAEAPFPDSAGYEAAEGTVFHEMVSDCLDLGLEPEDFEGKMMIEGGFEIEFDSDMVRYARDGIDFVRSFMGDPDVQVFIETRVDISPWTLPGQFGTADVIIINLRERWIIVFDWKYGKEPVYAQENYQLQGYCLGAWQTICGERFGWDPAGIDVTLIIEQPRVPGAGGSWKTTMTRVLEFGDFVRHQAVISTKEDAPRIPGTKQCRWCRARATCPELAAWHLDNIGLDLDDLDDGYMTGAPPLLPKDITPERRSYLLECRSMINQWFDALHQSAYNDATLGRPVPGMKLVEGRRPARKWAENAGHKAERAMVRLLGDGAYAPRQILSPAQVEKKVSNADYSEVLKRFVDEGSPSAILVSESDRREPIQSALDSLDVL